jgi:sugar O-acyltransferase (sialic acid O-acetyltransferase NeuD family)
MATSSPRIITTPQLGVNEDTARLYRRVEEGTRVRPGDVLCLLETVKASFEVEAEAEGILLYCVEEGADATVGQPLLLLCADEAQFAAEQAKLSAAQTQAEAAAGQYPATKRAQQRAKELGVDLAEVKPAHDIVQASDVEAHAAASQPAAPRRAIAELSWPTGTRPVVIHGAGRGGQTVLECLQAMAGVTAVAFVDDQPGSDAERFGLPLYPASELPALLAAGVTGYALGVAGGALRLRLLAAAQETGFEAVNLIHPSAVLSPSVELGAGVTIKAGAVVETGSRIGDASIIDNGVIVPHHNVIEPGCHLAPGVSLGSGITVGTGTVLGIGVTVATGCTIGRGCIVTPGSSIVTDIEPFSVIEGVPGKRIGAARGA